MRTLVALAVLAVGISPALAQETGPNLSGNELYSICTARDDLAKQGFCLGYVIGVIEGMKWGIAVPLLHAKKPLEEIERTTGGILGFCLPENVTNGQYQDLFVKYMADNPQSRHFSARLLGQLALAEAFPCSQSAQ